MTTTSTELPQRKAARIAGFGYLIMTILAIFANFFVLSGLIVPGDPTATVNNIMASEGLFRFGIVAFLIVIICDVVVAWTLNALFKPVNKGLSLLTAWFRLVYAVIFAAALINLLNVLQLLSDAEYLAALNSNQLQVETMTFLNAFNDGWLIGLVFFSLHLLGLGYLIIKSDIIPKIFGIFLLFASAGYLIDSFAHFLLLNYENYETIFTMISAIPSLVGELSFMFWLLIKGVRNRKAAINEIA